MNSRDIILRPIVTEESMSKVDNQKYTFEVKRKVNKCAIKHAIEEIFDVNVKKVNIMNVRGKLKRKGRYVGYTRKRRKAIVTLTKDSKEIKIFND